MELDLYELEEAFTFFDEDHDGKINPEEFSEMARALGFSPTDAEILSIQKVIEVRYQGYLRFVEFKDLLEKYLLPLQESLTSAPQTIKESFKVRLLRVQVASLGALQQGFAGFLRHSMNFAEEAMRTPSVSGTSAF